MISISFLFHHLVIFYGNELVIKMEFYFYFIVNVFGMDMKLVSVYCETINEVSVLQNNKNFVRVYVKVILKSIEGNE